MQWLFDIVLDMVWNDIYLKGIYRHRGDPADFDFTTLNFITDGAWHELDLSSIVPENAKGVSLALRIRASTIDRAASFRIAGQAQPYNSSRATTQVANQVYTSDINVAVDTDRKIEYNFANITWHLITLTVKGWWF